MLTLKLPFSEKFVAGAHIPANIFVAQTYMAATHELAGMLDSLVRVSRRDEPKNFVSEGLRHGLNPAECPKTYRERLPRPNPR